MNKRKSSPRQDYLDVKAIEAALDAQSLPPGPERTEALRKAKKLRAGPGRLNRVSASIGGASAGVRLPCGVAAG